MTNRYLSPLLCGGLLSLAVLTPASAPAAPGVRFSCSPTEVRGIASDLEDSTTSQIRVNIAQASVSFTQGGASASCVIVRFSADTFAGNDAIEIGASLDNNTASALPIVSQYSNNDSGQNARSFEFIFPSVAPGSHTLHMQFNSLQGGRVHVFVHNTVVQFAP